MDPAQSTAQNNSSTTTAIPTAGVQKNTELENINKELYKRNLELAERNKTLSLLRKLDEMVLSSVTDLKETALNVANLLVTDAQFRMSAIFLLDKDKKYISLIAFGKSPELSDQDKAQLDRFTIIKTFALNETDNLLSSVINEKKVKTTSSLSDILQTGSILTTEDAMIIQKAADIKSSIVLPIIIRDEVIGSVVVCQSYNIADLNEYQWDLLERLVAMVGIALDNAILYNEVQNTNQKLKVLDRLKDEFVSLASHELRTPMTAIKSYLFLFLEDNKFNLNDKQRLYIERAYSSTDRLITMVNDMLNVSRIESGRLIISKKRFDLAQLTTEVINEVKPTADENKIELIYNPSSNLAQIDADPDKIKQVLLNLIGNSIKFTHPGGKVTVEITQSDGNLVTTVRDTGKGISREDMPKLFKKFGIVSNASINAHGAQSTGLGLYISKSIVEMHGGKIWAESEGEDKGSVFYFSLHTVPQIPS